MDPATFLADLGPDAELAAMSTGFPEPVILAQWANETGWGTSSAFVTGHNLAGVSPGGRVASYPDLTTGLAAYEQTAQQGIYNPVRAAPSPEAAAVALGAGPWAGGHYEDSTNQGPGSALLQIMAQDEGDTAAAQLLASGNIAGAAAASGGSSSTQPSTAPTAATDTSILGVIPTPSDYVAVIGKDLLVATVVALGVGLVVLGAYRATQQAGAPSISEAAGAAAKVGAIAA